MAHQKCCFFTDALFLSLYHSYVMRNIFPAVAIKNIWPIFIIVVWQMIFNFLALSPFTSTTYSQCVFLKVSKLISCRQVCKPGEVCLSVIYIHSLLRVFLDFSDLCRQCSILPLTKSTVTKYLYTKTCYTQGHNVCGLNVL